MYMIRNVAMLHKKIFAICPDKKYYFLGKLSITASKALRFHLGAFLFLSAYTYVSLIAP